MNDAPRRDVAPWLLVRCESCEEECNCHPPDEMRWSRADPGGEPTPICEGCWDASPGDHEPDWFDLEPVVVRLAAP